MTKHQWLHRVILVAGTIVLAACPGTPGECEADDVTGEVFCNNGGSITEPNSPATLITDQDQTDN
jgi:hypothetical protein